MRQDHLAGQLLRIAVGMHQRAEVQRQQHVIELAAQRRVACRHFKAFDGVDQAHDLIIEVGDAWMRFSAFASQDAGHFDRPVRRDIVDMAVVRHVNVVFRLLVIVDGVNHLARRIGVVGPAALLQLFRFDVQVRIFIQIKQLLLDFLNDLRSRAALIVLAHFDSQHLFLLKVVKQVRARQQVQRADQPFAERQVKDVFHRCRRQATGSYAVQQFGKARFSVHDHVFNEYHVVQAEQVDGEIVAVVQRQHVADKHLHTNRNITDADKAFETGMTIDRLGHHPGRVGEVNHPRVRADLLHVFDDIENDRDGTQAFEQAARAVGLLPEIAVAQRDTLVQLARLQLADAQLGSHEISIFQRQTAVEGFMHGQRHAGFLHHALAQVENKIQLFLTFLNVHQP